MAKNNKKMNKWGRWEVGSGIGWVFNGYFFFFLGLTNECLALTNGCRSSRMCFSFLDFFFLIKRFWAFGQPSAYLCIS